MHISDGILNIEWCALWFIVAIPFIVLGAKKVIELVREHPDQKMTVALAGAFIFLLSSLKLPSVNGSSSHPTGTGFSAVIYGVSVTAFLATIVLIFQAILLAHGGISTLGANVVSMGIAGPLVGFLLWRVMIKGGMSFPISLAVAAFFADIVTYVVTSFEMALNAGFEYFGNYLSVFAITQIPLGIMEAILFFMFGTYLVSNRPDIFELAAGKDEGDDKDESEGVTA